MWPSSRIVALLCLGVPVLALGSPPAFESYLAQAFAQSPESARLGQVRSLLESPGPTGLADCASLPPCPQAGEAPCCNTAIRVTMSRAVDGPEEVIFASPSSEIKYRIPAYLPLPDGKEMVFAEKRMPPKGCEADAGYIQLVAKWRASRSTPWASVDEMLVCDVKTSVVSGVQLGDTCGNPTPVYDATTDTVLLLFNQNGGHVMQKDPIPGSTEMSAETGGRVCRKRVKGDRRTHWVRSRPVSAWSAQNLPFQTVSAGTDITDLVPNAAAWDAVGPGNGIQVSTDELVFPARNRNIWFKRGQNPPFSVEVLPDSRTDEGTVVMMNDGLLMRNDRPGSAPLREHQLGGESVFRRWMARQSGSGGDKPTWSPFTTDGQPLMPAHYDSEPEAPGTAGAGKMCGLRAPTCDPAKSDRDRGFSGVQGSVRRYSQGRDLARLVYSGPAATRDRWGLTIRISYDEGDSWPIGRELLPPTKRSPPDYKERPPYEGIYTGYSSVARQGDGVAVVYERMTNDSPGANDGEGEIQSIHYRWASFSALLCGRKEPIYIGGNAWLGNYYKALRKSGTTEYFGTGRLSGTVVEFVVIVPATELNHRVQGDTVELPVLLPGQTTLVTVTATRSNPGSFALPDGRVLVTDPYVPGQPWCDAGY